MVNFDRWRPSTRASLVLHPRPYTPALFSSTGAFLVTSHVQMQPKTLGSHIHLARQLGQLHTHHSENGMFGFSVKTMCRPPPTLDDPGELWADTWQTCFANMLTGFASKLSDAASANMTRRVVTEVVPVLLGELEDISPVLVHGDLCELYWTRCMNIKTIEHALNILLITQGRAIGRSMNTDNPSYTTRLAFL